MHTPLQHGQEREHHELMQAEVVWLVDVAEVFVQKRAPRALRQAPRPQAALQQPAHLCNQRAPGGANTIILTVSMQYCWLSQCNTILLSPTILLPETIQYSCRRQYNTPVGDNTPALRQAAAQAFSSTAPRPARRCGSRRRRVRKPCERKRARSVAHVGFGVEGQRRSVDELQECLHFILGIDWRRLRGRHRLHSIHTVRLSVFKPSGMSLIHLFSKPRAAMSTLGQFPEDLA